MLTEADRDYFRRLAAESPAWTDEQIAELSRIADSVPRTTAA